MASNHAISHQWLILTGEFPPSPGGVADYTSQLARGLAQAGDTVHVFAPGVPDASPFPGVWVHQLVDHFGPRGLTQLDRFLKDQPSRHRTLLLQYVPHAFGYRSMNVPLCLWWAAQRRERRAVMFHEVSAPVDWWFSWKHTLFGCIHHVMAERLLAGTDQVFMSTDAWRAMLVRLGGDERRMTMLPVPSNLPTAATDRGVRQVRHRLSGHGKLLVGSFGTFGPYIAPLLQKALLEILKDAPSTCALLIGRGAEIFLTKTIKAHPEFQGRLDAMDNLDPQQAADAIAACDVMIQPYLDGVTTRRTSLMAGLALGKAVVTNSGVSTEPLWQGSGAVALAPTPADIAAETVQLLQNDLLRTKLAAAAGQFYERTLSLPRVIDIMRAQCGAG